jgi:multiple sugar transport system ATP-binding protein
VEAMTMGDRIVIMKDGYIQQVGAPLEVYDFPQNAFVAGFIGSPPMNFFRGRLKNADGAMVVDLGSFQVKVPDDYRTSYTKYLDKDVIFGVRPEDIADEYPEERRGQWESFNAVVEVIEPLGAEIILELSKGEHNFIARVDPHSKSQLNQDVTVYFDMLKMHLFDPETEKVISR